MKRFILSIAILSFFTLFSCAQTITGKLVDENNHPLIGANALLLSKVDSSYITKTTTDEKGNFMLESNVDEGILLFSYIGYQNVYHCFKDKNVGTIKMYNNPHLLNMAIVTSSRIKNNAKGYSMHPQGSGLENCTTVQDMFAYLPGMSVTDNKIMLFGKLPIVYVNGVKITSQEELSALLPKRIENIQVDFLSIGEGATHKGGTIHIITKKEKNGGYSGYLNVQATTIKTYGITESSPTFVFDASTGKCTINYYVILSHRKLIEDATNDFLYNTGERTNVFSKSRSWMNNFGNRLNISYELNKNSQLALSEYIGNMAIKNRQHNTITNIWTENEQKSDIQLHGPESKFIQQSVAKYTLNTDQKGSNFELTADYLLQNYNLKQLEDKDELNISANKTNEKTNMFNIKPQYTHKDAKGGEWIVGAGYQYIHYNDYAEELRNKADAHIPSIYANVSGLAKTLMYSAGLTLQYNRMKVVTSEQTTTFSKVHLCPQGNLMWIINPQKERMLGLIYQYSISDMPYSVINNYHKYSTPYHYTTGNSTLHTPKEHNAILRMAFNKYISAMLMYTRELSPIYYKHGTDDLNNNITWSKPANGKYRQAIAARMEFAYSPTKWWNLKLQAEAMQIRCNLQNEHINGKWGGKFRWDNNFNFTSTFGGAINGYWETKINFENYYWQPVGDLSASLWKSLCKEKLRLSLYSTIWAKGRKSRMEGDGYTFYYHNVTKPLLFTFSLTWNFSGGKKVQHRSSAESIQQYKQIEEKK